MTKTRGKREAVPPKVAARTGGRRVAALTGRPFGAGDVVLIFLCLALALLIFAAALLPQWMGCTPYAVSSDSMSPTLRRGDLVFVQGVALDALEGGEIVVFHTENHLVTHRVYTVDKDARTLRTKADASPYLDAGSVAEAALVGRVLYKLPLLGYFSIGGEEALT